MHSLFTALLRTFFLATALCVAACQAQPNTPSGTATAPTPGSNSALQALVAKTKRNLVFVQSGSFLMGDFGPLHNAEKLPYYGGVDSMTLHKVTLDSFSMAAYKTTYEDYDVYTEITGLEKIAQDPRRIFFKRRTAPAGVPWQAARNYCQWLGQQIGVSMDLPTEAQWEYAARNRGQFVVFATDNGKLDMGRNLPTYEWLEVHNRAPGVYASATSGYEVGLFPPTPLGLYDMASNGHDWILDWYDDTYYAKSPMLNPTGPATGTKKVQRGNHNMGLTNLNIQGMTMVRHKLDPKSEFNSGHHIRCVANVPSRIE
jgi:formylglycine-generating enzyme required for sulfatase activity